jgi:hypothetical protein
MGKMRGAGLALLVGTALTLCLGPSLASAAETSTEREEYVAKVEPICKANVRANQRIFSGVRQEVRAGKLKLASRHFFRAAHAFARTVRKLAAVPRPSADTARLARWFRILGSEKTILERIGRALAAENRYKAGSSLAELTRNSYEANNTVVSFGFHYCRIEPSRFE